jgi:predicted anti-sigma-YlaC factor YlaD
LHPRPLLCERARGWISLSLDGELSELEQKLVSAHLRRCDECRAFEREVIGVSTLIRSAPLEAVPRRITIPARPRVARVAVLRLGAAAAVFVGALGLTGTLVIDGSPVERASVTPARTALADDANDRLIREARLSSLTPPPLIDRGRRALTIPL